MIDATKEVIDKLEAILPTYYELFADGSTPKPCITVQEYSNNDTDYGETLGYSAIQYMVKVWADSKADSVTYALLIDPAMRELGFHRVSATELMADHQICKLLLYEALGKEDYYDTEPEVVSRDGGIMHPWTTYEEENSND